MPVPSPSSKLPTPLPALLQPHVHTVPSALSAAEWQSPPETAITPVNPATCTGTLLSVVVLFPSWPLKLSPHAHTVPSVLTATTCFQPLDTWLTPVSPLTCTGAGSVWLLDPLPTSPCALLP